MTDSNPLVSTIIPAYSAEKYLAAAIESVWQQKYQPLEIIVIDNESSDRTSENAGAAAARNTGLELARGEIIAFIDAEYLSPFLN